MKLQTLINLIESSQSINFRKVPADGTVEYRWLTPGTTIQCSVTLRALLHYAEHESFLIYCEDQNMANGGANTGVYRDHVRFDSQLGNDLLDFIEQDGIDVSRLRASAPDNYTDMRMRQGEMGR